MKKHLTILVLGYIVRGPFGGLSWHHLQYLLSLRKLGHKVLFFEDSGNYASCYDPEKQTMTTDPSYGLNYISSLFHSFSLDDDWAYYDEHTDTWFNKGKNKFLEFCSSADILLNLSGVNPVRDWWSSFSYKIFIDTDPGFTQIKCLNHPLKMEEVLAHTHFFSFGENIGKDDCSIPTLGIDWLSTRQPVYLDVWSIGDTHAHTAWTTVMNWDDNSFDTYGDLSLGRKFFWLPQYYELPRLLPSESFEIALGGSEMRSFLISKDWKITDPNIVATTPFTFKNYIYSSKGEWTVAKHGYVVTNSGWFSERTLNYMAAAKPVVVHDTGFSSFIPTGKGIVSFKTLEEAVEAVNKINSDYKQHALAARAIIEEHFEGEIVLTKLLNSL